MRPRLSHATNIWTLIVLALAAIALLLPGCNIVGPAYAIASGPPKKSAEFVLQDRPTLVFVDDRSNVLSRRNLRRQIADRASEELMLQEAVMRTISPRDGLAVAQTETHGKPMAIDVIGRSVGADQVIYIEMLAFALSADGTTPVPMARCAVKVIDVTNREKLFPAINSTDEARMMDIAAGPVSMELYKTGATRRQIEDTLAEVVGTEISRLFFDHAPRELGRNLDPR
jgi:hypothetical protein